MRLLIALAFLAATACSTPQPTETAIIVVDAPVARAGALAKQIEQGARLAVEEINANGGVRAGPRTVKLEINVLDSGASPQQTAANMGATVRRRAVAVIDEGTGVDAGWRIANDAGIPIGIVYQGGEGLVDYAKRPNVFRIAPTDRGIAFRTAEYLIPKGARVAILTDDSEYGSNGRAALGRAFARDMSSVAATIAVPSAATDLSPEILRARRSGATALLVWARPSVIALAIRAARSSGWNVAFYTPTAGEDPLIRQQLADRPEWIDGLTVALSRLTSEKGPQFFARFRKAYEDRFGAERIGVRSRGRDVVQPPDVPMYAYDFVRIVAAAMAHAGTATPGPALVKSMTSVEVFGANGDERAFNELNHEGVVDDDVFFVVFKDMVWTPVRDDALSATLPPVPQTE
jgi:ABC-type branched-subunit amino acid transport system substrate-binding protein